MKTPRDETPEGADRKPELLDHYRKCLEDFQALEFLLPISIESPEQAEAARRVFTARLEQLKRLRAAIEAVHRAALAANVTLPANVEGLPAWAPRKRPAVH